LLATRDAPPFVHHDHLRAPARFLACARSPADDHLRCSPLSLLPNDSTFTAREWPGMPAPAWPDCSRLPQSFAEWFPTTMTSCTITLTPPRSLSPPRCSAGA